MTDDMTGQSSSGLTIGMGSLGSIDFDQGQGGFGLDGIDNVVPIAFEEADYGISTGMVDVGSVVGKYGAFHWTMPEMFSGLATVISYQPRTAGAAVADGGTDGLATTAGTNNYSFTARYKPEMLPGLEIGGGMGESPDGGTGHNRDREEETPPRSC